jgi:hypothetical protein
LAGTDKMKIRSAHIAIACLLLTLISVSAYTQVSAKASVDKDHILIGEPIKLTLQVYAPLGEELSWFTLDTIPRFEFVSKGKIDTTESVDGKKMEQELVITSFDSGSIQIPPLNIVAGATSYFTDSIPIEVSYSKFNPEEDYRDIKAIEEVFNPLAKYIPWAVAVLTVLSFAGVAWFLQKRKQIPVEKKTVTSRLTPLEEAMKALDTLKKKDTATLASVKAYYTDLNDILRVFVFRKLSISSLEQTNEELILELKELIPNRDSFSKLAAALRMSDFVKFAKYQPGPADNESNLEIIRAVIRLIDQKNERQTP